MAGKVLRRVFKNGDIKDYPSTYKAAEKIYEARLDRRKNYCIIDEEVCEEYSFTKSCSGCFEAGDYGGNLRRYRYDKKSHCHVGAGCEECGYQGKVRISVWHPLSMAPLSVPNEVIK